MTKKDRELISFIGKFGILAITQLSFLSQRNDQSIRRRMRYLLDKSTIHIRQRPYGQKKGRPENLLSLTDEGWRIFLEQNGGSYSKFLKIEKSMATNFIEHELLLNWGLIHLIQIERKIDHLSVKYLTQNLAILKSLHGNKNGIIEQAPIKDSNQDFSEFIPDAAFMIKCSVSKKSLLFFLEVDMGTETKASPKRMKSDIRQKIINYQGYFGSGQYKRYNKIFGARFKGFRLLFLTNSFPRLKTLCRLVREMPPSDFVWLTNRERMFSSGLSAKIWSRGGRDGESHHSILGEKLACKISVVGK
jgi:Replication-relaxation